MIYHYTLECTFYEIECPLLPRGASLTLAHLSDVHSARYGSCADQAAAALRAHPPELICCTGDLIDCRHDADGALFFSLLDRAPQVPVVASLGNHEKRVELHCGIQAFRAGCQARGITLLDNASAVLDTPAGPLRFYGYLQRFIFYSDRTGSTRARLTQRVSANDLRQALGPCGDDGILLAHDPAPFAAYAEWGAPLTLSGHIHGGQIRLPLVGGVLSPARRFFPRYSAGRYTLPRGGGRSPAQLIVSRGLVYPKAPRILNRPELSWIRLVGTRGA